MGKETPEELHSLLNEVDAFLEEVDEEQPSLEDEQGSFGNLAGRERLIRELFQETEPSLNGAVELQVSEDEMQVNLDCYPPQGQGEPISPKVVENQLVDAEISYGIDWDTIQESLFACNTERRQISGVIIARGTKPEPEVPEHLLLRKDLINPAEENPPKEEPQDKRGQIDYRQRSPFTIVEKGEVLAKLKRKKEGSLGYTVRGTSIPFRSIKLKQLTPGENTEWKGDTVIAGCYGRFIHGDESFGVKEVLEISSNVDYHTGNIDFPGDVIINGEVKDRFTVRSGGSIFCNSTLDAHDVSCKGDLVVAGGIIGRKDGVVKAGGKIRTNFIENCYVEAEGPIFVKTSVMNSIVNTKGKLTMGSRGTIIGGKLFTQNGVEAAQIGTHTQTRTEINCGVDFSIQQKLFWIKDNQIKLLEKKRKIEAMLSKRSDDLEKLTQLRDEISGKIRKLSEVSIILLERLDKNDAAYVAVSDTVHSGVYIEICHTSFVVKNPMTKVRFTLNKKMGKIDFKAL